MSFIVVIGSQFLGGVLATHNVVIDWTVPTSANGLSYSNMDSSHRFLVGDSLGFRYEPSQDNVVSVSETAFSSCDVSQALEVWDEGNTTVTFDRAGSLWFVSGFAGHCEAGQAFKVTVTDDSTASFLSPAPEPDPAPAPAAGSSGVGEGSTIDGWGGVWTCLRIYANCKQLDSRLWRCKDSEDVGTLLIRGHPWDCGFVARWPGL